MKKLKFRIASLIISLETDSDDFVDFCLKNFNHHVIDIECESAEGLSVKFYKNNDLRKPEDFNKVISKGVYSSDGKDELFCFTSEYNVHYKADKTLKLVVGYNNRHNIFRAIRKARLGVNFIKPDYFMLFRNIILFPAFYVLETRLDSAVIHGAAYQLYDKTIMLAGLANVGKSATSLAATLQAEGKLIGDNYIVIQKDKVYGVIEAIRIDKDNLFKNLLADRKPILIRNKRDFIQLDSNEVLMSSFVDAIAIPALSKDFKTKKVGVEQALDHIQYANVFVNELYYTNEVSLLRFVDEANCSISDKRNRRLRDFISDKKVIKVDFNKYITPVENVEALNVYLSNQ